MMFHRLKIGRPFLVLFGELIRPHPFLHLVRHAFSRVVLSLPI